MPTMSNGEGGEEFETSTCPVDDGDDAVDDDDDDSDSVEFVDKDNDDDDDTVLSGTVPIITHSPSLSH